AVQEARIIYSPSFPESPGVSECDYLLIEQKANARVEVEISVFESTLCCDSLIIYDGFFGSNILKTMSGSYSEPVKVQANSNVIRMLWNSTSGSNVRG
ncbi:hypothetical protein PENTCL1PPCAC_7712, partial [Pristionchus entomophagus]